MQDRYSGDFTDLSLILKYFVKAAAGIKPEVIGKVKSINNPNIFVSTLLAIDTEIYETAIGPDITDNWIIVEYYETKEAAIEGHQKWVNRSDWQNSYQDIHSKRIKYLNKNDSETKGKE